MKPAYRKPEDPSPRDHTGSGQHLSLVPGSRIVIPIASPLAVAAWLDRDYHNHTHSAPVAAHHPDSALLCTSPFPPPSIFFPSLSLLHSLGRLRSDRERLRVALQEGRLLADLEDELGRRLVQETGHRCYLPKGRRDVGRWDL